MSAALSLAPADHVRLLHPAGRRGVAAVATRDTAWVERTVPIADLAEYARAMKGATDTYVSQQAFYGWRRITHLAQLGAFYADIDYKDSRWAGETPERVAYSILHQLQDHTLPEPSYVLATGYGLCLVWLHEPVPRQALPRWRAAQRVLQKVLAPYGADPLATDAARLFRICGTRHSRADAVVKPVWMQADPGSITRWSFDDLVNEILPFTRDDLAEMRSRRAARDAHGREPAKPTQRLTVASFWETALTDIQKLRRLRWFGPLPPGHRDMWMLIGVTAMSYLAPASSLPREVRSLVDEAGGWEPSEALSRMATVIRKAEAAARGERVEWQGQSVDPRYRFSAATMVGWLRITQDEMRRGDLRLLIDADVRRERATERQHLHRRRLGVQERSSYIADAASHAGERAATAKVLRAEGMPWQAVADRMGLPSADAARKLAGRGE